MAHLNEMELQNVRHLIGAHETAEVKMATYAHNCNDQQLKQFFQQSSQSAQQTKQQLINFLS